MLISLLYAAGPAAPAAAAAAGAAAPEGSSMIQGLLPLVVIFVLFYFIILMPNRKEQKKHQEMLKTLKPGDKIITNGGIVGTIDKIIEADDVIRIKSGENTLLNLKRSFVSSRVEKPSEQTAAADKK